jgi:hypothetical protein
MTMHGMSEYVIRVRPTQDGNYTATLRPLCPHHPIDAVTAPGQHPSTGAGASAAAAVVAAVANYMIQEANA